MGLFRSFGRRFNRTAGPLTQEDPGKQFDDPREKTEPFEDPQPPPTPDQEIAIARRMIEHYTPKLLNPETRDDYKNIPYYQESIERAKAKLKELLGE